MDIFDYKKLNPVDPKDFSLLEEDFKDILLTENTSYAEEALNYVNEILQKRGTEIENKFPQLYDRYQFYWVKLAFIAFPLLETVDQGNLIKSRVLFAVQNGLDSDRFLRNYYSLFESDEFVKNNFREFAKSLEQNDEQFGKMSIIVDGRKMLPTLKYWILDYSKFPSKVARRTSVERLNYINQSVNTRALTQTQRQTLLKILKLFDDLINGERPITQVNSKGRVLDVDFTPAPAPPEQIKKFPIDIQKKLDELKNRAR
ncbi:MAG: hypothetical protein NVSMB66_5260 [Candidatus Doudnabacteria bacterium]